jgi:hypothetical protein
MNETRMVTPAPQRLRALERANEVRLARAELKRRIAEGEATAATVILTCPREASSWTVGDLLMSQRRWGRTRCRKFLARNQISEVKTVGALTERQRRLLAAQLELQEPLGGAAPRTRSNPRPPHRGPDRLEQDQFEPLQIESEQLGREELALVGVA